MRKVNLLQSDLNYFTDQQQIPGGPDLVRGPVTENPLY